MKTLPTASRRALLMGFAAAATPMAPALANALSEAPTRPGADAELLDLCRRTIEQSERHAQADLNADRLDGELAYKGPYRPELEDRAQVAKERERVEFDRLKELYSAVTNTPALTSEGIYAKATVAWACWGGQLEGDLDNLMTTTDAKVALSLVRDLINRGQA
jgi:hypothetical protein